MTWPSVHVYTHLSMAQYRKLGSCNDPWLFLVCWLPRFCDSRFEDAPQNLHQTLCSITTPSRFPLAALRDHVRHYYFGKPTAGVLGTSSAISTHNIGPPGQHCRLLTETWLDPGVHDSEIMYASSDTNFPKDRPAVVGASWQLPP